MITIMPSGDSDNSAAPPSENTNAEAANTNAEQHKTRLPLIWIPATLVVGLLIAAIYLGGRIVRAHPSAQSAAQPALAHLTTSIPTRVKPTVQNKPPEAKEPTPVTATVATAKVEPPSPTKQFVGPEPLTVVTPDDGIPMITPRSGELYIQVGALNSEATRRFVQHLRNEKLEPHVAPGPKPELMRVLIGPFDNHDALNERKAQLQAEGMDTFVRQY
jgi:cell division septation protein DedD